MLIKICGITHLDDARFAVECGANALGFVFWPGSPRAIDPARAQVIAASLPPFVTPVGVFVNQPADFVNGVAADVGLGVVQLHGDENVDFATSLTRPVLKALTLPFVGSGLRACEDITSTAETAEPPPGNSRQTLRAPRLDATLDEAIEGWPSGTMILLDAHDPVRRGGTGLTIDWTRAASIAARRPIVLAGGLNPDNVAAAIERVRPFGIDVSSGVEAAPGVKDHGLLNRLVDAVRGAESTRSPQGTQWTQR